VWGCQAPVIKDSSVNPSQKNIFYSEENLSKMLSQATMFIRRDFGESSNGNGIRLLHSKNDIISVITICITGKGGYVLFFQYFTVWKLRAFVGILIIWIAVPTLHMISSQIMYYTQAEVYLWSFSDGCSDVHVNPKPVFNVSQLYLV